MDPLDLPAYDFRTRTIRGKRMIYDPVRGKYVRLTPEEWVRQHFVQYLVQELGYPPALLAIEAAFTYQGMDRRADVIAHDRSGRPALLVECKAPNVPVSQDTFDQAAGYNRVIRARFLVVTNGYDHYCCEIDHEARSYRFMDQLPPFDDVS